MVGFFYTFFSSLLISFELSQHFVLGISISDSLKQNQLLQIKRHSPILFPFQNRSHFVALPMLFVLMLHQLKNPGEK
jgi:hypothetical protein